MMGVKPKWPPASGDCVHWGHRSRKALSPHLALMWPAGCPVSLTDPTLCPSSSDRQVRDHPFNGGVKAQVS